MAQMSGKSEWPLALLQSRPRLMSPCSSKFQVITCGKSSLKPDKLNGSAIMPLADDTLRIPNLLSCGNALFRQCFVNRLISVVVILTYAPCSS